MSLHYVATQAVRNRQGALQVDKLALGQVPQVGAAHGLGDHLHLETG